MVGDDINGKVNNAFHYNISNDNVVPQLASVLRTIRKEILRSILNQNAFLTVRPMLYMRSIWVFDLTLRLFVLDEYW